MTPFKNLFSRCFSLLLFIGTVNSQELPPIEKFTPEDYNGGNQNWMISQASNKFIYVANHNGLLEYDGAKWKAYTSPNNTVVRAVNVIDSLVYTGSYMEFGYWMKNSVGILQYNSLIPELKMKMIDDEHIWNIISYDEWVLFQSLNRIYFYNTKTKKFKNIDSKNPIGKIYNIQNTIYYNVTNEGLYKIEGGNSVLIVKESLLKKGKIVNVFPIENGLLILSRKKGFYLYKNKKIGKWDIPSDGMLQKMTIFNSIQLKDKSFMLGTISNGIVYLDVDGNIINHINQNNGLSNNTALTIFEDIDENIWVGLDNGINCINVKSPVQIFKDDKGVLGTVYASTIFNEHLYLGTNQGLFYKNKRKNESFKFVTGTAGQVWNLFIFNNELFCGHHNGTYTIEKGVATSISSIPGTWNFRVIPTLKNSLLQGNYQGLNIITKENGKWKWKNKIKGFDNSARYVEIVNYNEIWISHGYKGVFQLIINDEFTEVKNFYKIPELQIGKNSSLIKYNDKLLYAFKGGIYKNAINSNKNIFVKDTILSSLVSSGGYLSGKLVVDDTQKLWSFSKESINYAVVNDLTNKYKINSIDISTNLRKGMVGYEIMTHLEKEKYLLGTSNGYVTLDLSEINSIYPPQLYLNTITVKTLGLPDLSIEIENSNELTYKQNSIVFNYSVPDYSKFHVTKYQYKLKGHYNIWSEWTRNSEVTFKNLPFGDYNLKIRAKVGGLLTKNIISYNFKINRPWYLSNTAIVVYLILTIFLIFVIHRAYRNYYNEQHAHKQLENEQLIMRIKNEKLTQDIDNKNRELAISTMSTIKRNEMLSGIKKELMNINDDSKKILPVIKLIDKNLSNTKDWKFFEEAFNNADKHFLDKIKSVHPNLTPNDLRFCAYLRLNLSSKEIAPLLNISVRSVEIKRYRLRKKMNLEHFESLVSHILEI